MKEKYCMISVSKVSFAGQSGHSYMQGANMEEQSSSRVETGQCCFRQQERPQVGQYQQMNKEDTGPMLVEGGHLASEDKGKMKALNAFFSSVFNIKSRPWTVHSPESEDFVSSDIPSVNIEIVRNKLDQLNVHKSMGSGRINLRVLKESVDVKPGTSLKDFRILERSPLTGS